MDLKLLTKVKKGVEHCKSCSPVCEYCPYNKKPTSTTYDCYSVLRSNILYLINDLEFEIAKGEHNE